MEPWTHVHSVTIATKGGEWTGWGLYLDGSPSSVTPTPNLILVFALFLRFRPSPFVTGPGPLNRSHPKFLPNSLKLSYSP